MCGGSRPKPSTPPPPPVLPEAPTMPEAPTDTTGASAADADKRRRAAATGSGRASTVLTGARGVEETGQTATKTLLGQ